MAGAPGGWESAMKKKLKMRRERALRKQKLKTFLLKVVFFPVMVLLFLINYAINLHKNG